MMIVHDEPTGDLYSSHRVGVVNFFEAHTGARLKFFYSEFLTWLAISVATYHIFYQELKVYIQNKFMKFQF